MTPDEHRIAQWREFVEGHRVLTEPTELTDELLGELLAAHRQYMQALHHLTTLLATLGEGP